jgi:hypothetical protein
MKRKTLKERENYRNKILREETEGRRSICSIKHTRNVGGNV